jgi:hypothetical protein
MNAFIKTLRQASLGLALLGMSVAASAQQAANDLYHVVIDATHLAGSGWLDLQFNPGQDSAPLAFANLVHFQGAVTPGEVAQVAGSVSGHFGGRDLLFTNNTAYNDLFQAVQFGQKISFDIHFSGPFKTADSTIGSSFGLALYGADQATAIGNGDAASGSLLSFSLTPANGTQFGASNAVVYDSALISVNAVPEPSEWAMMIAGLAVLGVVAKRRQRIAA